MSHIIFYLQCVCVDKSIYMYVYTSYTRKVYLVFCTGGGKMYFMLYLAIYKYIRGTFRLPGPSVVVVHVYIILTYHPAVGHCRLSCRWRRVTEMSLMYKMPYRGTHKCEHRFLVVTVSIRLYTVSFTVNKWQ